jgi:hypothetical protein
MNVLLKIEEAAELVIAYVITLLLGFTWWTFFTLLFFPDLFMVGYVVNARVGAMLYNLGHHKGVAIVVALLGLSFSDSVCILIAAVLFGHSALDRLLGFGMKYTDDFKHTHLGWIGK